MKIVNRRTKKLNNKGMSLVEVLVAMIILSIAGVAFLQSFSYAVRYNALAKEKQKALTYAQSMMEAAKAFSVEELDNGKYKVYSVADSNYSVNVESSGLHTYVIDGVENQYTITMTAEPTLTDATAAVVQKDIDVLHNPNKKTDAFFFQNLEDDMDALMQDCWTKMVASTDTNFVTFLNNDVSSYLALDPSFITITSRVMKISASSTTDTEVKVYTTYSYKVTDYAYTYYDATGTLKNDTFDLAETSTTITSSNCFDASLGGDLTNIYFYYYPLYKTNLFSSRGWPKCESDSIIISSEIYPDVVDVHIYKQKLPGATQAQQDTIDTNTTSVEALYNVMVSRDSAATGQINVYHNLLGSLYGNPMSSNLYTVVDGFADNSSTIDTGVAKTLEDQTFVYTVKVVVNNGTTDLVTLNGSTNIKQ